MKRKFTVILLRPDYIANSNEPADTYMTYVKAESAGKAIAKAQRKAFRADFGEDESAGNPYDYVVLFIFFGHVESV